MPTIRAVVVVLPDTLPADDPSVADDRRFLDDWERGVAFGLSAILRMRQLRRALAVAATSAVAKQEHEIRNYLS